MSPQVVYVMSVHPWTLYIVPLQKLYINSLVAKAVMCCLLGGRALKPAQAGTQAALTNCYLGLSPAF